MRRRLTQLVSIALTAGLLLGGLAGLSPLMHVWLEHGGQGPAHVHLRGAVPKSVQTARAVAETAAVGQPIRVAVRSAAERAHTFQLPTTALAKLWRSLLHHFGHDDAAPDAHVPASAHHHNSVAQTLAGGLIVLAVTALLWLAAGTIAMPALAVWDGFRLTSVFARLHPERGPPVCAG